MQHAGLLFAAVRLLFQCALKPTLVLRLSTLALVGQLPVLACSRQPHTTTFTHTTPWRRTDALDDALVASD